jgi:uncharacterized protein DUF6923
MKSKFAFPTSLSALALTALLVMTGPVWAGADSMLTAVGNVVQADTAASVKVANLSQGTNLSDIQVVTKPGHDAPGDVIETFAVTWGASPIGLCYYPPSDFVHFAHENGDGVPTVFDIDYAAGHALLGSITFSVVNPGWPATLDQKDGAGYDPGTDTFFGADYNGDLSIRDDYICEYDTTGLILNAWETDGADNDSSDGSAIDTIIDVAVVPGTPNRYFACGLSYTGVKEIELTRSGMWVAASWSTVTQWTVSGIGQAVGIDYDAEHGVLYVCDFNSTNVAVVDLTGTVLGNFSCSAGSYNTGVTYVENSSPPEVWVTDFGSVSCARCEAIAMGTPAPTPTGPTPTPTITPTPGPGLEAWAVDAYPGATYAHWDDLLTPGTWTTNGDLSAYSLFAGDFLNDNYSMEYVINYDDNTLYTLDTATVVLTAVGACVPVAGDSWSGLTGAADGTLYAVSTNITTSNLYTVDPLTGTATHIGEMTGVAGAIDCAINDRGDLYVHCIVADSIYQIDTTTGAGTLIGLTNISANYAQGMDFDMVAGILYLAAYTTQGELRQVDLITGDASTLIGAFPGGDEVTCLGIVGASGPTPTPPPTPTGPTPTPTVTPTQAPGLEAWAVDSYPGATYAHWDDLLTPGTWTTNGDLSAYSLFAGDFLNDNYSMEYVINYDDNTLYTLDTATVVLTAVGACVPVAGDSWSGLTGAADGTLYAVSTNITTSNLYTVNPMTGAAEHIGEITNVAGAIDVAINGRGDMYTHCIVADSIYLVNTETGAGTLIGPTNISANYAQGMDFDMASGFLYLAAYTTQGELRQVSLDTGDASNLIGAFPGGDEVTCLGIVTASEPTPTPPPPPTETAVPPTETPVEPTATVPTGVPTNTPVPPTDTPVPPTDTPVPPTDTPVPPTDTPVPPTDTPVPPTNTPVPPTSTPECTTLGCEVFMPKDDFVAGDECFCDVYVCNPTHETYTNVPVFVILDVYGLYYFAPTFSDFDYYTETVAPGKMTISVIPSFTWPGNVGTASGILWYAAMTDAGITKLFGDLGMFSFGWH